MPKPQIYTSYVNQMCSSLLIGIIEAPMGLTVEDIFGTVVHNVTVIDFVRESFVSSPVLGESDIHGDTGWWRLSNTTGTLEESMFNVDHTGASLSPGVTSILRTIQALDSGSNLFEGLTTNMSGIASGTATLDDPTKFSWFAGVSTGPNFVISVLDPGVTSTSFLTNDNGLFNLVRQPTSNSVVMQLFPDLTEAGEITLQTSSNVGNPANLLVFNGDGSQFNWNNTGAGTSSFKISDAVSHALFEWLPNAAIPGNIFTVTEGTGQALLQIEEVATDQTVAKIFAASSGAAFKIGSSSTAADAFIQADLASGPLWLQATPGVLILENDTLTGSMFEIQDSIPMVIGSSSTFTPNGTGAVSLTALAPFGASATVVEWLTIQHGSGGPRRFIPCF